MSCAMKSKLLAIFLAGSALAAAGAEEWQACGWGGGGFYFSTVFHPTQSGVIYLGGDVNGVYKSEDHGQSWRMINRGLANYAIYSLAVDRKNPQTVYAATLDGLCKSTDAGEHWQLLPRTGKKELRITGERNKSVRAIAVDPTDGNIVYAASPAGKVFKSTDGGQNWNAVYEKSAAVEPVEHARVQFGKITGDWHGGLWLPLEFPQGADAKSCDGLGVTFKGGGAAPRDCFLTLKLTGGTSFRSRNLNAEFANTQWRDVVLKTAEFSLDPEYAKKHPGSAPALDWAAVQRMDFVCVGPPDTAVEGKFSRFFFAGAQPQPFCDVARLKKAAFYGNARCGAAAGGNVYSVAVAAKLPALVLAATEDAGVLISDDAGKAWRACATPKKVACVAVAEGDPNIIVAACFKDGVWKSTDQGKTWSAASQGLAQECAIREVAISPADPRELVAIGAAEWNGYCYRSHDGGQSWTNVSQMAVDRTGNPTFLMGGDKPRTRVSAPTNVAFNPQDPHELFISANWRCCWSGDGGLTWAERDRGADISCIYDIRFHNGRVYAAAMDEGAFFSGDEGKSWKQIAPTKYDVSLNGHCWRLAINGAGSAERILATFSPWWNKYPPRVVISEDGGKGYSVVTNGLPDHVPTANTMWGLGHARALAVDPKDPRTVYLGMDGDPSGGKSGGGFFKSTDGGRTWRQMPRQPGSRRVFFGLAVDPTDSRRLYWAACGTGGGLYRSDDAGESWQHVFKNESWLFNVLVAPDGTVYAPGGNLWRSTDHGKTWKQLTKFKSDGGIILGLEGDPADAKRLWCSVIHWGDSARGGVWRTTDGGATWQELTGNLPHCKPMVLRYNAATRDLWAGGVGLYRLKQ